MTDRLIEPVIEDMPTKFSQEQIGWTPWLEPLVEGELGSRHLEALVDKARAKSSYFALLVRDPDTLEARTKADKDIFYNSSGGLPRGDRELSATAVSRENGCLLCASIHARFATQYSKRGADIDRLLEDGTSAELGERWNAIVATAVALTATPVALSGKDIETMRKVGLSDHEISDVIHGAAFFNWANRLMLSLGEPTLAGNSV